MKILTLLLLSASLAFAQVPTYKLDQAATAVGIKGGTIPPDAVVSHGLIDKNGNVLANGVSGVLALAADTTIGGSAVVALGTITLADAHAFTVGPNGTTNPTLDVNTATASAATGIKITAAAAAGGVAIVVTSSGTNENATVNTKGSGTLTFNNVATGAVHFGSAVVFDANKGVTVTSGTSAFDFSGGSGIFKTPTGLVTIGGKMAIKVIATPVAAAGNAHGNAAALGSANIVTISSDSAAKGVILVTGVAGDVVNILNTSGTAAALYPASGGTLNGQAADAGVVIPASKGVICICTAADTWTVFDRASASANYP